MSRSNFNGGYRVYVGEINSRIERTDLQREFGQYGPVIDVYMGRKRDPNMQQMFAFVVFRYPEDADEAVRDRNGRKLCGSYVKVEHAKPFREDGRRGGFQRGGYGGYRGFSNRGGYGGRGSYNGNGSFRDHDRWSGPSRDRGDYSTRRRDKFRQSRSPSPGYNPSSYSQGGGGGRWQSRSPIMERRRNHSFSEAETGRAARYNSDQSPEVEKRHKKLSKSKKRLSSSLSPPAKKKSRKRKASSSEDQSNSSSTDSRSPSPQPKKKKKKKKKSKSMSARSRSISGSPEYDPYRTTNQSENPNHEVYPRKKKLRKEYEEKEEGYLSSSSG